MRYGFSDGARIPPGQDADQVGNELERLRAAAGGLLTAEGVLGAAKRKRSPLHDFFEWDDNRAAQRYRLAQASYLLRVVVVVPEDDEERFHPVRAFVTVGQPDEAQPRTFTHVRAAMADDDMRDQVLGRARRELAGWRRRYRQLEEFAAVLEAIDSVLVA